MKYSLCYALVLLALISCQKEEKPQFDLAIKNVNVIDLQTGAVSEQSIIIHENRINTLIPKRPEGTFIDNDYEAAQTIDGEGLYVLPGYWDNHVHFRGGDSLAMANKALLPLFLANGVTTVRDAGGDLTGEVMNWKAAMNQGTLNGPSIFTSGPKLDGPQATWAGSLVVENKAQVEYALDSLQKLQVDFVKLYDSTISRDNYLHILREAKKRGMITSGHMPFTVTLEEAIEAGIGSIEHLYYIMKGCSAKEEAITERIRKGELSFWESMDELRATYSEEKAQQTFAMLKANEVYVTPTLHIGETLSYLDEDDHSDDVYAAYVAPGLQKTYAGRIERALNASEEAKTSRKELQEFFNTLAFKLNEAGVSLLAGSDCGAYNSYVYPGISLHEELKALVDAGLTELDALNTSAPHGAAFLGKEHYGSLQVGNYADLVILAGNPLEDIKLSRKLTHLIQQGKVFTLEELEEKLPRY
ncbi:amidohydrolase family protein [Croceiramulus getboli]|nr:amidohydrolase family protein [Flavobacteriaceae bacterium YJPT1-3]